MMDSMPFTQWPGILVPATGLLLTALIATFVYVSVHESQDIRETIAAILNISTENQNLIDVRWGLVPFWIPRFMHRSIIVRIPLKAAPTIKDKEMANDAAGRLRDALAMDDVLPPYLEHRIWQWRFTR